MKQWKHQKTFYLGCMVMTKALDDPDTLLLWPFESVRQGAN